MPRPPPVARSASACAKPAAGTRSSMRTSSASPVRPPSAPTRRLPRRARRNGPSARALSAARPSRSTRSTARGRSPSCTARSDVAGSGVARALHGAQLLLEVLHLVAQPRGELELQFPRRCQHLLAEVGDGRLELLRPLGRDALAPQLRGRALADTGLG